MTNAKLWLPALASALFLTSLTSCGGLAQVPPPQPATQAIAPAAQAPRFVYPKARRETVVDVYHGTKVADPYRWLEDADSPETAAWVRAQNRGTAKFLNSIAERDAITKRLTKLWDYEKFGLPQKHGNRYFYSHNDGLQNQSVLYWAPSLEAKPTILLDPNTLSEDGTIALGGYSISDDGKYMAYGLQSAGSDWAEWHLREVVSGKVLSETLKWIKFSGAHWDHLSTGFYYSRYPEPKAGSGLTEANFNQKVYYHEIGTPQSIDTLVFETPGEPRWGSEVVVSEDGRFLIASVSKGTGPVNQVHVRDLKARGKHARWRPLISNFEASYIFLANIGSTLYFQTDKDAPRGRIIAIEAGESPPHSWKEIVPQSDATLQSASFVGGKLVTNYLRDAKSEIVIRDRHGVELSTLPLPGIGTVRGFGGRMEQEETFYSFTGFTGFTAARTLYQYDFRSGTSAVFKQANVDFDASKFETEQVFYQSKDGTRVPMFLVHKKGIVLDGSNPTELYGYGGFSISLTPYFSISRMVWLEMGGLLAIPNLRGGGEYGEKWHLAGVRLNKQNVFDDFIAAAEWLIAHNYTSSAKLGISGRSNGGLLVGAAMTQRPELFAAALPGVGVMDMLRFHKFTIGWAWIDDYGSSDDAEEFKALLAYSPYHNLRKVDYPATLITTADHDDRVVPAHSFKFAAMLQYMNTGENPQMIRIESKAGHGGGKPTSKRIQDAADHYAFLAKALGMHIPKQVLAPPAKPSPATADPASAESNGL